MSEPVPAARSGLPENARTAWTAACAAGQVVRRHAGDNPDGSADAIAGVCHAEGNIAGLMAHPEHAIDPLTGPSAGGLGFLASAVAQVAVA